MNKKEVTEIKKLFTKERCCLNRLCGCYVDADKNPIGAGNGRGHTEKPTGAA